MTWLCLAQPTNLERSCRREFGKTQACTKSFFSRSNRITSAVWKQIQDDTGLQKVLDDLKADDLACKNSGGPRLTTNVDGSRFAPVPGILMLTTNSGEKETCNSHSDCVKLMIRISLNEPYIFLPLLWKNCKNCQTNT